MKKIVTFFSLIRNPGKLIYTLAGKGFFKWMPDKLYLNMTFFSIFGRGIDWKCPKTFNEKLQWLKIYDRNEKYSFLVDKYEVKRIITEQFGSEYIIPNIAIWNTVHDINFDKLPEKFVLKCTHDSGSVIICKDKNTFDERKAKSSLRKHLNKNPYWFGREWPYRSVQPRIIAEQYLEDEDKQLKDYKFMCFNGDMKCCMVFSDRYSENGVKLNAYDRNWNPMSLGRKYTKPNSTLHMPQNYKQMIEFAERLSKNIPFVRVDFYEVCGKLYFGEMTFYPNSGFTAFNPEVWDEILGDWLVLP